MQPVGSTGSAELCGPGITNCLGAVCFPRRSDGGSGLAPPFVDEAAELPGQLGPVGEQALDFVVLDLQQGDFVEGVHVGEVGLVGERGDADERALVQAAHAGD